MPSAVAVVVLPPSTEPRLESSPSPSSSSFFTTPSSDAITAATAANLLATATTLVTAGQSLKCTEALSAQKQHRITYIQQQQRIQQEKQRQLIYSQQQRHQQYLRCSGQMPYTTPGRAFIDNGKNKAMGGTGKGKEPKFVDLVDDVWRLIFFILACDCKDLGRVMQCGLETLCLLILIANDALLWRLTYKLTISGSIFAGQKPLLSPSWIREHQLSVQEASESLASSSSALQGRSGSTSNGALPHTLKKFSSYMIDRNDDGLDSMPINTGEHGLCRGSVGNVEAASSSALSALASSRSHSGSQSTGALLQPNSITNTNATRTAVSIAPGLQMPSPLILPHHRRIAQSMNAVNTSSGQPTVFTPAQVASSSQSQLSYFSGTTSTNSSSGNLGPTTTRTPASTPATTSMPSFSSTLSSSVSQVAATNSSATPIRVIQHHIPSTTLMHHSPAVYWKYQVAEWLEQEKLRCLRLGLFWGFNAAASKVHGRKPHGTL
ncbi:hypothetical protein KI688_002852 [Linnemannia hyalina]|uniref:Uncharacterized protein n=1 Tax=Linnemannia hyalina TaxID=64524 RepID=A0A9P7XPD7_9FUNG|nr:hypothetical protein KI688_002852 [Linnemannia hyalina]